MTCVPIRRRHWLASSSGRSKKIPRAGRSRLTTSPLRSRVGSSPRPRAPLVRASVRRSATRWWMAIAAVALLAAAVPGAWFIRQNARTRWAREQALPQIDQLSEREQYAEAFAIAQQAKQYIPNDPVWKRIDPIVSRRVTVQTTPAGAAVSYRPVGSSRWVDPAGRSAHGGGGRAECVPRVADSKSPATSRPPTQRASAIAPVLTLQVTLHTLRTDAAGDGARHRGRSASRRLDRRAWITCRRNAFAISGSIVTR